MMKPDSVPAIRLRGVRQNNLKNFDLDVLLGRLTVITGLSGSGKSSLAFDTLFAEGQRRYIETFSPYARQFFDRMDKPQVERIEGIPPAIAIEQRNTVRTTRSTVGTMTELCDYMKLLWPHLAQLHCRQCGQPVRREPPQLVWDSLRADPRFNEAGAEAVVVFDLPLSAKLSLADSLELIARQGYQRLLAGQEIIRIEAAAAHPALRPAPSALVVVQDRVALSPANRARFTEACEQAYHFGKGKLAVFPAPRGAGAPKLDARQARLFSLGFHCAACDLDYREPTPALFSFNHPLGACPTCKGFGRVIRIDYDLAIPDRSKSLEEGCVKPWQSGHGLESQGDLMKFCRAMEIPTDIPFENLPKKVQSWVIDGDKDYGIDEEHHWPRLWYGVKGYFRWLESKAYKMHVRVLLSRYRAYTLCPDCRGQRFKPDSLLFRVQANPAADHDVSGTAQAGLSLAEFYAMPVDQALAFLDAVGRRRRGGATDPIAVALGEARARLQYLVEVGLGYLTLDRPMRTLSGGETERVNLTTCLGTRLCNTLFVLDEPSVGLHPRDTSRLVRILEKLRDTGNTVVVVEHEASVMKAADRVVDLGPGQGEKGGEILFNGPVSDLLHSEQSLTGQYLSGRKQIPIPARRPVRLDARPEKPPDAAPGNPRDARSLSMRAEGGSRAGGGQANPRLTGTASAADLVAHEATTPYRALGACHPAPDEATPALTIDRATWHNLRDFSAAIPLRRFVCLTGVSGSGKTTLVRDVLLPALARHLPTDGGARKASDHFGSDSAQGEEEDEAGSGGPSRHGGVLAGWESLSQVVLVDQAPLGKTPRSNPVVYIGAFDDIRELFAQTEAARQRGLNASAFSFNSGVGQCERCRGAGFEKIEMQFLSDIFIRCPDCNGRRYRGHILDVKLERPIWPTETERRLDEAGRSETEAASLANAPAWSIADMLEATVDEAYDFLRGFGPAPAGRRALQRLKLLREVGLGYLRLGQPINTLSGGESQRLKLVSHLAESMVTPAKSPRAGRRKATGPTAISAAPDRAAPRTGPTLFLFDEPTTGLHFEDVRILLQVFQRLVDGGHSLLVIEHNLDVIKSADWVIDLGPDAGERGGQIVARGTPEEIAQCNGSQTGLFLREVLRRTGPRADTEGGYSGNLGAPKRSRPAKRTRAPLPSSASALSVGKEG